VPADNGKVLVLPSKTAHMTNGGHLNLV